MTTTQPTGTDVHAATAALAELLDAEAGYRALMASWLGVRGPGLRERKHRELDAARERIAAAKRAVSDTTA